MNQLISLETIFVENNQSWPTALGYINEISKQYETHKILDCLWSLIRETGATGFAYFYSSNIIQVDKTSGVKAYQYGTANEKISEIWRIFEQVSNLNTTDTEISSSESTNGSTISCPVFGPYNSKGVFIVDCRKPPGQLSESEIGKLNYVLLKSQIYIAEIEAKQRIESAALSKREIQVLQHLIKGRSNNEIAQILGVSVHTINGYVRFLMLKLDVKDRVSACMAGLSILQ